MLPLALYSSTQWLKVVVTPWFSYHAGPSVGAVCRSIWYAGQRSSFAKKKLAEK
jgi:hypothetical protein